MPYRVTHYLKPFKIHAIIYIYLRYFVIPIIIALTSGCTYMDYNKALINTSSCIMSKAFSSTKSGAYFLLFFFIETTRYTSF